MLRVLFLFCLIFSFTISFSQKERAKEPKVSNIGGFYSDSIVVKFKVKKGEKIFYTLDGSKPSKSSRLFSEPIVLKKTSVLKAKKYKKGYKSSKTITYTYFINHFSFLPTISLSTDPEILWDENKGIYVRGPSESYDSIAPFYKANFHKNWTREFYLELYEPSGELGISQPIELKIFGGWSRCLPQKSFSIKAEKKYGKKKIKYNLFPDKDVNKFKSFVLRNSGSDWGGSLFRDALMTYLVSDLDFESQAYRPAVVYLNGEYWGIYNIREKINKHFIASNCGVDKDNIDLLEHKGHVIKEGDNKHYYKMLRFMRKNDLNNDKNFEHLKTMMDVDNYMKFSIAQIYFDNQDAGGNIRYWRERNSDGRWRWILYDTDWGFGLHDKKAFKNNTLEFATEPNGPRWPNPPWSTFILRKLLENESFKRDFIIAFSDYLNTHFRPNIVSYKIDILKELLEIDAENHFDRWNGDMEKWNENIESLRGFGLKRPAYLRQYIMDYFNISDTVNVTINNNPVNCGKIRFNSISINSKTWDGIYFKGSPVTFEAQPELGYSFVGWDGAKNDSDRTIVIYLEDSLNITANYRYNDKSVYYGNVKISEICFHKSDSADVGDWIEIYNPTDSTVDISGWIINHDGKDIYRMPDSSIIETKSFLILCEDTLMFMIENGKDINIIGNIDFDIDSLSKFICLYDKNECIVDTIPLDIVFDGNSNKSNIIALKDYNDNSNSISKWFFEYGKGTPGRVSSYSISDYIENKKVHIIILLALSVLAITWFRRKKSEKRKLV